MTMGVYAIRNRITGDRYVGSSINIEKRVKQHTGRLNACLSLAREFGTPAWHSEDKLMSDWTKYGRDAFEVDVLEEHDDEAAMRERELYIIFNEPCAYNRQPRRQPLRINYPSNDSEGIATD